MLRTVYLYGPLEKLAGTKKLELDADNPVALVRGLRSQVKGFRAFCDEHRIAFLLSGPNGTKAQPLNPQDFTLKLGSSTEVHLVPEVEGSGFEAAAIVAAIQSGAYLTAAYYIAVNIAIAVAVGAIAQALAPSPDTSAGSGRADERPSFLYNGAVNVVEQGYPVPVVYGTHMVGSIVISAGVEVEDIPYTTAKDSEPSNSTSPAQPANPTTEAWQWNGA